MIAITTSTSISVNPRPPAPFVDEFLFTNVDVEGLMRGIDRDAIENVRSATTRAVTVAGGVTTEDEIAWLDARGMDAVVGMAIYTGRLRIAPDQS